MAFRFSHHKCIHVSCKLETIANLHVIGIYFKALREINNSIIFKILLKHDAVKESTYFYSLFAVNHNLHYSDRKIFYYHYGVQMETQIASYIKKNAIEIRNRECGH